jgi:hypothetical protein
VRRDLRSVVTLYIVSALSIVCEGTTKNSLPVPTYVIIF